MTRVDADAVSAYREVVVGCARSHRGFEPHDGRVGCCLRAIPVERRKVTMHIEKMHSDEVDIDAALVAR